MGQGQTKEYKFEEFEVKFSESPASALSYAQSALAQEGLTERQRAMWLTNAGHMKLRCNQAKGARQDLEAAKALLEKDPDQNDATVKQSLIAINAWLKIADKVDSGDVWPIQETSAVSPRAIGGVLALAAVAGGAAYYLKAKQGQ